MKLQALYDLQQEINRLFIAGSKFAKGDPRLQKHVPVLNKLGEKAPVFKKLATDIEDLLNADTQQAADKLMALSTLLYSVLYTQGELTEADVEEKPQTPSIDINDVNTNYSYLQLKPVIEALTISNSGRLEVLKDAFERKVFKDSRTYQYLNIALADKYSELSEYVEKTIIPSIGKPMIPFLLQSFQYEDKTEQVRRFRLLHTLGYPEIQSMIDKILSESLPNLQAEAISILSDNPINEELIIKLSDDKNKIVREAAYKALAKLNTKTSLEKLSDVYIKNKNKTNLPFIVNALALSRLPFFFQEVFNQVAQSFEAFIALDKDKDEKTLVDKLNTFEVSIDILENKANSQVFNFLGEVLSNKQYNELISAKKNVLENSAYSISHSVIKILDSLDSGQKLSFYEKNMDRIPPVNWKTPLWNNYFFTAVESGYLKEKVYNIFGELLKKNIITINNLYHAHSNDVNAYYYNDDEVQIYIEKIDPRWMDIIYNFFSGKIKWSYEHEQGLKMLHAFENEKSEKLNKLLIELTNKVQPSSQVEIFRLIVEREVPNRFEIIYSVMEKFPKNTYYYALNRLNNKNFWNRFPKEYESKFRKLYEKNKLEIYNHIADEISMKN